MPTRVRAIAVILRRQKEGDLFEKTREVDLGNLARSCRGCSVFDCGDRHAL
ncbi:hypothetical protein CULT_2440005 [[Clostridium] ultunense Esp]|nr:hypothetical protein CULT_2440005 [[Clostridium] ultunense Esp]